FSHWPDKQKLSRAQKIRKWFRLRCIPSLRAPCAIPCRFWCGQSGPPQQAMSIYEQLPLYIHEAENTSCPFCKYSRVWKDELRMKLFLNGLVAEFGEYRSFVFTCEIPKKAPPVKFRLSDAQGLRRSKDVAIWLRGRV